MVEHLWYIYIILNWRWSLVTDCMSSCKVKPAHLQAICDHQILIASEYIYLNTKTNLVFPLCFYTRSYSYSTYSYSKSYSFLCPCPCQSWTVFPSPSSPCLSLSLSPLSASLPASSSFFNFLSLPSSFSTFRDRLSHHGVHLLSRVSHPPFYRSGSLLHAD